MKDKKLHQSDLSVIAGVGYFENIPAKEAPSGWTLGIVKLPDEQILVSDYKAHRIWRIDQKGILHTLAGDGVPGNSGDGGLAINARLNGPHDLALDSQNNLYFSDLFNNSYRKIDLNTGIITKVVGSGAVGRGGEGGNALNAEIDTTSGIAIDKKGNIFISGEWDNNIRKIDATTGLISTFAGYNARHYFSEKNNSRPFTGRISGGSYSWETGLSLGGFHGDGGPAKYAGFLHPEHIVFDNDGDLYICDNSNNRIRKIDMKSGVITTVFGNGQFASNGDGGPATEASTCMPDSIFVDSQKNIYVGEKNGYRVRKVDGKTGIVSTLVGNGTPGWGEDGLKGNETLCNSCESGLWADSDETVFWSDCSGRVRKIDGKSKIVTTVFGGTSIHDDGPPEKAFLRGPGGIAVDQQNNIYFADIWNQRIRKIDENSKKISTIAGNGGRGFAGESEIATSACLGSPHDISIDKNGEVFIADTRNSRIRKIDAKGIITTIVGTGTAWDKGESGKAIDAFLYQPQSISHDNNNNLLIGDGIGKIKRVNSKTKNIETIAGIGIQGYDGDGGPAIKAKIGCPSAIAFDNNNNLYFSDTAFHVIRKIDAKGIITTVVGNGKSGFSPDGTLSENSMLNTPWGLAVSKDNRIFISDSKNQLIRTISESNTIVTIIGNQENETPSKIIEPHGLCLYNDDKMLLISDHCDNKIYSFNV